VVYVQAPRRQVSSAAVVSLVFGILWLWGIWSLIALVVGIAGVRECRDNDMAGDTAAVFGVILGVLGLAATVLLVIAQ
jgi:Domain of unknown function (DUF4190)